MFVTEFGIVTDVRQLQLLNALSPMLVTEAGIVTDVRPSQPEKAEFARLADPPETTALVIDRYDEGKTDDIVNCPGIVTDLRPLQP